MAVESNAESADPWAFMAPWCGVLQGRLRLRCGVQYMHRTPSDDKRWELHVALASTPKLDDSPARDLASVTDGDFAAMGELREALELLSSIAVVDNDTWRRLLAGCVTVEPREGDQFVPNEFFPLPPFRFRLDERDAGFAELSCLLQQFFVIAEQHPTSEKFQAARRQILAITSASRREECPDTSALLEHQVLPIPFNLELFPARSDDSEALATALGYVFRTLDAVKERQRAGRRKEGELDQGFLTAYFLRSRTLFTGAVSIGPRLARALIGYSQDDGNPVDQVKQLPSFCDLTDWSLSLNADVQLPMTLAGRVFRHIATENTETKYVNQNTIAKDGRSAQSASDRTLSLMFDSASNWKFRCAISALVNARRIDMVTLDGMFETPDLSPTAQRLKWQWLAFVLFSEVSAGSSIIKVVLDDLRIAPSDVDAIAAVLRSTQPEPRVIATGGDADFEAAARVDYVRLHPNAILCMQPPPMTDESGGDHQQPMNQHSAPFSLEYERKDDRDDCWFQVLDDAELSAHSVSILVPGYGKCIAPRSSIAETDRRANASATRGKQSDTHGSGGSVRSLSLSFDHDIDATVLPRLLQLVGHSLEYLSIANVGCRRWHHHRNSIDNGVDLAWLARTCPNLRHLRLADSHVQLDSLIGAATVCKLKILEVHGCHITTSGVRQFAKALSDAGTRLATHLTELSLHCCDESRRGLGQTGVEALEAMLASNLRLQFLRVWIPRQLSETYTPRLRAFDAEPLAVVRERLPLTCKLAFLSCAASSHRSAEKTNTENRMASAVPVLNDDVLRGVFALAATCETRRVEVLDL